MNLELPFYELPDAELDAYLARVDQALDALFLDEVRANLDALRAVRGNLEALAAPPAAGKTAA